jgi:hypothetical protein
VYLSKEIQFSQDLLEQILSLVESVIARMAAVSSADDLLESEQGKQSGLPLPWLAETKPSVQGQAKTQHD